MLTNGGHLILNQIGNVILLRMKVNINESSIAEIFYFQDVANIAGVHIKMDTSNEKVINMHFKDRKKNHFKACAEGLF